MSDPKMNIQVWDIDRLVPYEQNVKKHPPEQVARVAKSLLEFGWNQPVSVDKNGVLITGHGRRLAVLSIIEQGKQIPRWPDRAKVPVWVRDDLTEAQVRALRLADNRAAEGQIDAKLFQLELSTLDFDLEGIFDAKELEFAVADLGQLSEAPFVEDIGAAIDEQTAEVREKAQAASQKRVPVARVLGFKDVAGPNQIKISRLVAHIEGVTGKKGEEAMAAFYDQISVTHG